MRTEVQRQPITDATLATLPRFVAGLVQDVARNLGKREWELYHHIHRPSRFDPELAWIFESRDERWWLYVKGSTRWVALGELDPFPVAMSEGATTDDTDLWFVSEVDSEPDLLVIWRFHFVDSL